MSQSPSLNREFDVTQLTPQVPSPSTHVNQQALPISCIDLIAKLENLLARSSEMDRDDFVDQSADIARKMLSRLSEFHGEFFVDMVQNPAREEIARAVTHADAYELVLKTRPLANAVLRAFWNVKESQDIQAAHAELGRALVAACAATCGQAVVAIGSDTEVGQEINQSTVSLVSQLQSLWA